MDGLSNTLNILNNNNNDDDVDNNNNNHFQATNRNGAFYIWLNTVRFTTVFRTL